MTIILPKQYAVHAIDRWRKPGTVGVPRPRLHLALTLQGRERPVRRV